MNGEYRRLLFLCTGNYYRSRFAEILFNHLAAQHDIPWQADSRGLHLVASNEGPISRHTLRALERLGIAVDAEHRYPRRVDDEDFEVAHLVVAVKETEHRPMVKRDFPHREAQVEFWEIHDVDFAPPHVALPELGWHVERLAERLR